MTTSFTRTSPSHLHDGQGVESPLPADLLTVLLLWLTKEEIDQIRDQLHRTCIPNRQLLWSGVLIETAQHWADGHGYQTLTTAMGPLMRKSCPECPFRRKLKSWPRYVHGASVIFAWHIAQGDFVTVLSQPPPQRFHPSGKTFYESVEQPIIQGVFGNRAVRKIFAVHPMVNNGAEFPPYQMWPKDEASMWLATFGEQGSMRNWRVIPTSRKKDLSAFLKVGIAFMLMELSHVDALGRLCDRIRQHRWHQLQQRQQVVQLRIRSSARRQKLDTKYGCPLNSQRTCLSR